MPSANVVPSSHYLLAALPNKDRELLLAYCEAIELTFAQVLSRAGLEAASCTCYRNEKETYRRILD